MIIFVLIILSFGSTFYSDFCSYEAKFARKYSKLILNNLPIPMEPFPVFLGIKLVPKLSYRSHLEHITTKIVDRIRLIRKIKSMNLKNQTEICLTIFKSLIRSIFDYAFIPTISPTQQITKQLQILQNRALRSIKFFPLKTSTKTIHDFFKIDQISTRANKIAKKYANSRQAHPQLREDYALFAATRTASETSKFKTIFD